MRSLQLAKERLADKMEFAATEFVPFEFDPPGTYPPEGTDWTEYCKSYGEAKAKFLLEEKLPRAFELGSRVGINFRMDRRIVDTVNVNAALELAQLHGVAESFVLQTLSRHFEHLENPNDSSALRSRLENLGVPVEEIDAALTDADRIARNRERTRAARLLLRGGVPQFEVRCGGSVDLCAAAAGGPTSPVYFERIFHLCGDPGRSEL